MGKALTYIGGMLLAVLCALLVVPRFVDWNNFRGAFEEEASRVLGREVRVGGGVNLRLLPSPYVRFERLRISDASGTLGEPFFRAESFTMGLAVAPLLRGALEATHIELREPVLTLALDGEGRGNWRDVALSPGIAAILPAEVRLHEVDIVNGRLTIKGGGDGELLRVEAINGELSADNIDGPFKFRGTVGWQGDPREVRIATARPDPDGSVRFKGLVKPAATAASYTLDAKLSDLGGKPRIEGDFAARVPLTVAARKAAAAGTVAKGDGETESLELRSRITGDAFSFSLPEVLAAFDQAGQPQLLAGEATASWRDGLTLKIALNSRWLDLDKLAGSAAGAGPIEAVRAMLPGLVSLLPQSARADVRLAIDQVNLGGEAVSDLRLAMERVRGPMQIRELQLGLPGGARFEVSGALDVAPTETSFSGDLAVRGTSYARFLGWAAKGQTLVDTRNDGPFSLQGRLALGPKSIELADFNGEFLGAALKGTIGYGWGERRRIDVRLEGPQIDLSSLLPGGLDPAQVKPLLWPGDGKSSGTAGGKPSVLGLFDAGAADARFVVRAGELGDGERVLRDVDAALSVERGQLSISTLRLTTSDGVRLELDGMVADVTKVPRGTLRGIVTAADAEAAAGLAHGLGLVSADTERASQRRLEQLAPLRLAGSLRIGERGRSSSDLSLDGTLNGARAVLRMDSDAEPQRWREGMLDLSASIENAAAGAVVAGLLAGDVGSSLPALDTTGGQLVVRASGRPDAGLLTWTALKGEQMSVQLQGKMAVPAVGARTFDGVARVETTRAQPVLALLGLGPAAKSVLGDLAMRGSADIVSSGGTVHVKTGQLAVGGAEIAGTVSLTPVPGKPTGIDARLSMPAVSVAGLLAPILESKRTGVPREASVASAAGDQTWPDKAFDFTALDGIEGKVRLAIGKLGLDGDLALSDAVLELELAPNQVKVSNLDGRALGGDFKGRLVLERAPLAGVSLAGALRFDDAHLDTVAGKAEARGTAGLLMQFSARALSPQALISSLQGKGDLTLSQVQLARPSPAGLPRAVDAMLEGKAEATPETLRKLLREGLASGGLTLPPAKIPFVIAEGAAKLQRHAFETPDARGSVEVTVDLSALKLDAEWRMEGKASPRRAAPTVPAAHDAARPKDPGAASVPAKDRGPLPGISIVYVGPLKAIAALEPRINSEALEREVLVRRMERDVEELERLRREDEERYRREQERQRSLEEERKRALEQGLAAPQPQPAGPATAAGLMPAPVPPAPVPVTAPPALSGQPPPRFAVPQPLPPPGQPVPASAPQSADTAPGTGTTPQLPAEAGQAVQQPVSGIKRPPRPAQAQPPPRFQPFQPFAN